MAFQAASNSMKNLGDEFQAVLSGTKTAGDGAAHETSLPVGRKRRMRARKACEPCRERKRRCDGSNPCTNCVRYEYDCSYVSVRRTRPAAPLSPPQASTLPLKESPSELLTSTSVEVMPNPSVDTETHPLEANSSAAFVRKLTLAIDPANAPRSHLFAWNLFMGARTLNLTPRRRPIVDIISRQTMDQLASVYLTSFDPCYGFIDRDLLHQRIQACWEPRLLTDVYDPVLCGIAALGYLFSRVQVEQAELDLSETAKFSLEQNTDDQPSIDIVTGWMLRVAYLRMTATPHVAWMASCSLMHIIDASGILFTGTSSAIPGVTVQRDSAALGGRLFGIARHLNIWMSYDLGRSRVALTQAKTAVPTERPGEFTVELLNLLPLSEQLDPGTATNVAQLRTALWEVLGRKHTQPPSVLAQTNLTLCIYRRLRALDFHLSGDLLDAVLALTSRATAAAHTMLDFGNPWHHVANVPFQVLCVLLAIDTAQSLAQLGDTMKTLSNVVHIYNTPAATEALNTARLLILLHQRRKDQEAKQLSDTLRAYKPLPLVESNVGGGVSSSGNLNTFEDTSWLDSLMMDIPNLQGFDAGNLLEDNFQADLQTGWI